MSTAFWLFAVFAFVLGAVIGSFLNVVIVRYPRGTSIVSPASQCPDCGAAIRWYHNIPIVSWLALGGRCFNCDARISARYPLVEAATGLMTFGLWWKVARGHFEIAAAPSQLPLPAILLPFGFYLVFLGLSVVICAVDFEHYVIPHVFTLPGIALGLAYPWFVDWLVRPGALHRFWPPVTWEESLLGAVAGATAVAVVYFAYLAVRGVEGLGGGDLTLMAFVGAWLGWPALPFVFFGASLQGLAAALVSRLAGSEWLRPKGEIYDEEDADDADEATGTGQLAVPFGPFIVLAALEHFFLGPYLPHILSAGYLYQMWAL